MKIVKPDLVIVLLVKPEVSFELIKKKAERSYIGGKGADLAEQNIEHQERSYQEYLKMIENDKSWVAVNCCRDGRLLSIEEINKLVLEEIKKRDLI
jgi:thymidylate kinase